ncbi:MAG: DUF2520 domain-containing protein [Legionella sp.]|nr:DUF2520 domain-containing protein [Legionella sp.]
MNCNIIGAGRLGKNLGLSLSAAHIISSVSVCNRKIKSANTACQLMGYGHAVDEIERLPEADITWICCNDDYIPDIVEILAHRFLVKPGSFVVHSSGVLNSSLLAPLKDQGCSVASFHPLKAFKMGYLSPSAFEQVDCVMEGDEEVSAWLKESFTKLGAHVTTIQPEAKAIYHAAACIASNYLITLASCSEELLLKAGLEQQQSRRMLLNLMQGNLSNLQQTECIAESLTGPLMRGDIKTLSTHLYSIENQEIQNLYRAAGLATLPLTLLAEEKKEQIKNLFKL